MNVSDNWSIRLDSLCNEYDQVLMTEANFEEILRGLCNHPQSHLANVTCEFCRTRPFDDLFIGKQIDGVNPSIHTYPLEDGLGTSCKISLWQRIEGGRIPFDPVHTSARIFELAKCFWKPKMRDTGTGLFYLKSPGAYQVVDYSLSKLFGNREYLFVFFSDLDRFKQVNDTLGQLEGDRVITELASVFNKAVRPDGLVLHLSGDEFIVLFAADYPDQALSLAHRMMSNVAAHDFNVGTLRVQASSGIARIAASEVPKSFKMLQERAEAALKPQGATKNRGKATFESTAEINKPSVDGKSLRDRAVCIAKSGMAATRPFDNPWLNMLSLKVFEKLVLDPDLTKVRPHIEGLVDWIQPDLDSQVVMSAVEYDRASNCSRRLSAFDLCIAVAHGVFRSYLRIKESGHAAKTLVVRCSADLLACELCVSPGNEVLAHFGKNDVGLTDTIDLGHAWSSMREDAGNHDLSRLAFIIKIGHFEIGLPRSLFSEIMVLDDRPTMGGGLPDFWEATIARLIARADANPNVGGVYVLGKKEYAKQTIQKLKDIESWSSQTEQIAYKTGMPTDSIRRAANQLKEKIYFPETEEQLLAGILELVRRPHDLQVTTKTRAHEEAFGLLSRDLSMKEMALGTADGCRVRTIAEAYPVVLEIARKAAQETTIKDQAGQENLELIDFKVHLTTPTVNLVPAFYEEEEDLLERYFVDQFISTSGLFARRFRENGQLEAVLKHVADTIRDRRHAFATRRAVIVVPHEIRQNEELAPLGLISIRIIPRFLNNRVQLHYSYTWRTVEALVGFPYSLYGSVRFSQHLTDDLKKVLTEEDQRCVAMGDVSYIAHSLHIYKDDYGQNIARRIVNDASR